MCRATKGTNTWSMAQGVRDPFGQDPSFGDRRLSPTPAWHLLVKHTSNEWVNKGQSWIKWESEWGVGNVDHRNHHLENIHRWDAGTREDYACLRHPAFHLSMPLFARSGELCLPTRIWQYCPLYSMDAHPQDWSKANRIVCLSLFLLCWQLAHQKQFQINIRRFDCWTFFLALSSSSIHSHAVSLAQTGA